MKYPGTTPWTWAYLAVYPRGSLFIRLVARESVKSMHAWVSQKIKNSIGLFTRSEGNLSSRKIREGGSSCFNSIYMQWDVLVPRAKMFLAQKNDMKEDPSTMDKTDKNGGGDHGL